MNDTEDREGLVERLRQRRVTNWIHSTGTTARANGTKPDPDCIAAADEIERCSKLRIVAAQVLADLKSQGLLIEWQTMLAEAMDA